VDKYNLGEMVANSELDFGPGTADGRRAPPCRKQLPRDKSPAGLNGRINETYLIYVEIMTTGPPASPRWDVPINSRRGAVAHRKKNSNMSWLVRFA
jgi:hypothetical protein